MLYNKQGLYAPLFLYGEIEMKLMRRFFNPALDAIEEYYYNEQDEKIYYRKIEQLGNHIEANQQDFNFHNGVGYGDSQGVHKVASIPLILIDKWKKEHGFDWFNSTDREKRLWLDKPEHAFLKVRPGKLSGTTGNKLSSKRA